MDMRVHSLSRVMSPISIRISKNWMATHHRPPRLLTNLRRSLLGSRRSLSDSWLFRYPRADQYQARSDQENGLEFRQRRAEPVWSAEERQDEDRTLNPSHWCYSIETSKWVLFRARSEALTSSAVLLYRTRPRKDDFARTTKS